MLFRSPGDLAALHRIRSVMARSADEVNLPELHSGLPRRFCLFVGYPRSGHSLVGSLLDAHPNVVLAHEFNTLKLHRQGLDVGELCALLQVNSAMFARMGRAWTGYSYEVPGQQQGTAEVLNVLGDKKGAGTTRQLRKHPQALAKLESALGVPVTLLHVMRHPLDNIAAWAQRQDMPLADACDSYFALVETVAAVRDARGEQVVDVYLESLIAEPAAELRRVCRRLGCGIRDTHLEACAAVVFRAPRQSRRRLEWPVGLRDRVLRRAAGYGFLRPYVEGAIE